MNNLYQNNKSLLKILGITGLSTLVATMGSVWFGRYVIKRSVNNVARTLLTEPYDRNLMEFASAAARVGMQNIVENSLRAEKGKVIHRPLGSPRKFIHFEDLVFNVAQLQRMPTEEGINVDISVVIGPKSKKPLNLAIPIIISAMSFGTALSKKAKIAIAKGAAKAGTASNTGEAGMLPEEREVAKYLILQFPRGHWSRELKVLKQADMIEIPIGQGASAGTSHMIKAKDLGSKSRKIMGLIKGQDTVIEARLPELQRGWTMDEVVKYLKEVTGGIPVGIKLAGGKYLEQDIELALKANVDFITLSGGQGGSSGGPPILQDDFGLPTLITLCRGVKFLEKCNMKGKISLIIDGSLFNPGQLLKAIALGANAVAIGTSALFAVTHNQALQAMPYEPPTQVTWYKGLYSKQFNVEMGANNLYKYLCSCAGEIVEGIKALGKKSLMEVNKDDLIALTPEIAKITGVELAY
ncbi:MAG: FMN-binding glutamate synthase family protein [Bacillota bacterium]